MKRTGSVASNSTSTPAPSATVRIASTWGEDLPSRLFTSPGRSDSLGRLLVGGIVIPEDRPLLGEHIRSSTRPLPELVTARLVGKPVDALSSVRIVRIRIPPDLGHVVVRRRVEERDP